MFFHIKVRGENNNDYKSNNEKKLGNRKDKGEINEASLKEEGFIHCSFFEQALKVAEKHFSHEEEVLLLTIDLTLLKAEIKYELASNSKNIRMFTEQLI